MTQPSNSTEKFEARITRPEAKLVVDGELDAADLDARQFAGERAW